MGVHGYRGGAHNNEGDDGTELPYADVDDGGYGAYYASGGSVEMHDVRLLRDDPAPIWKSSTPTNISEVAWDQVLQCLIAKSTCDVANTTQLKCVAWAQNSLVKHVFSRCDTLKRVVWYFEEGGVVL